MWKGKLCHFRAAQCTAQYTHTECTLTMHSCTESDLHSHSAVHKRTWKPCFTDHHYPFCDNYQKVSASSILTSKTTLRFFTKENCWVLANPTQQPCWGHRTSSPYQQLRQKERLSSFFVHSCIIWIKACWPSKLSASWENHPSRKTFFFLFPMFPPRDKSLLPGSQWPWALL